MPPTEGRALNSSHDARPVPPRPLVRPDPVSTAATISINLIENAPRCLFAAETAELLASDGNGLPAYPPRAAGDRKRLACALAELVNRRGLERASEVLFRWTDRAQLLGQAFSYCSDQVVPQRGIERRPDVLCGTAAVAAPSRSRTNSR